MLNRKVFLGIGMMVVALLIGVLAACAGDEGAQGLKGDKGDTGATGATGAQGSQGPQGQAPSAEEIKALIAEALRGAPITVSSIARGGRLYDNWIKETKATTPATNMPLWALQTTNTRSGADTWRCKECHGWDYKGKGGTYSSGSHKTGFPGVITASATMSKDELMDVLLGAQDFRHDFSGVLSDTDLTDLVSFLSEGVINDALYLDYNASGKPPKTADVTNGQALFGTACILCHGADGKQILIDGELGIGDVARDEPTVEIIHKIRTGQPGTAMPSAIVNGWSVQDALDVLAYVQTLGK